ncbi:hypothetical protein D3C80_2060990 [compost metagenome]
MGEHEAPKATVERLDLQATVGADVYALFQVVDPDVQMVLFLAHFLSGQLDRHAQQAGVLVVPLGIPVLYKAQGPCAAVAVGR